MNLLKRLAISGGVLLSILGGAKATFFEKPFTPLPDQRYIDFFGRFGFSNPIYSRFANKGDEVAILRNNLVVGLSDFINSQSYYIQLRAYIDDPRTSKIDGLRASLDLNYGIDYVIRAFDSQTGKVWDVEGRGGIFKIEGDKIKDLDLRAYNLTNDNINNYSNINPIPEVSTIALFGLGAGTIALGLRKRK